MYPHSAIEPEGWIMAVCVFIRAGSCGFLTNCAAVGVPVVAPPAPVPADPSGSGRLGLVARAVWVGDGFGYPPNI